MDVLIKLQVNTHYVQNTIDFNGKGLKLDL